MKRKEQLIKKSVGAPLANTPDKAERRLDNIRPREVSLVDAAANGRSFLVIKRREQMKVKDKTIMKGGEEAPAETPAAAAPVPAPAAGSEVPAAAATETPAEQPAADAPAEEVAVEKGEFGKMAEAKLASINIAKALAMPQKEMFLAMSDALMSFCMGMDMIASDLMSFMGSDGKTGFMGTEVVKSALKKEDPTLTDEQLTEKAGKKMKKDRLMKLKQLHGELENLIKELDDETQNVTKGGTVNTQNGKKNDQETNKSAEGAAAAPATTTQSGETPAAPKAEGNLTPAQVEEIVNKAVEKATGPLKSEIEALKNAPSAPAGETAESTEDVNTNKSAAGEDGKGKKQESIFKGLIKS